MDLAKAPVKVERLWCKFSEDGSVVRDESDNDGASPSSESFWVDYTLSRVTAGAEERLRKAVKSKEPSSGALMDLAAEILEDWDVEANGQRVLITPKALREIPGRFVSEVLNVVFAAQRPDPKA